MAPKPNGFLIFMKEFKRREENKGKKFKNGLRDVQADPECNKLWQALSQEEKAEYNRRAKDTPVVLKKKTGAGETMTDVQKQKKKREEFESNMKEEIETTIANAMEKDALPEEKFYFIHSNWFYRRQINEQEFDYGPAEFAIAEFSLKHGVTNIYHQIIKTKIPIGFTREAMETSQETHQLPWDLPEGEHCYRVMGEKLKEFLKSKKKGNLYPPLYTSRKIQPPVEALLKRMTEHIDVPVDTFLVYELEILFMHFRRAALQKNHLSDDFRLAMAEYELIKDAFSFAPGLDCNFHKNLDGTSQYCSLSNVRRWAFTICDYCCEYFEIPVEEGVHCPMRVIGRNNESESLINSIQKMHIQDTITIKSETGVSNKHRKQVSERTEEQELLRRKEKKVITVIDFAKRNTESVSTPSFAHSFTADVEEIKRPLRPPNSTSQAVMLGKKNEHCYDESDFPSLGVNAGRGGGPLKKQMNGSKSTSRGRGIAMN